MFARPVDEIDPLHGKARRRADLDPSSSENPLAGITGDLFEIRAAAEVGPDGALTFTARGVRSPTMPPEITSHAATKRPRSVRIPVRFLSRSWSIAARSRSSATMAAWRSRTG